VSCDVTHADIFNDVSNWLQGGELRDWVFKSADMSTDTTVA